MLNNQLNDPLFSNQWHLLNNGQKAGLKAGIDLNVVPVWNDYTGKGVKVGIQEGGTTDITHPDLIANYNANLDYNAITNDGNVLASPLSEHATATAGIIGAAANNGIGGVGVAYNAAIANFRFDYGSTSTQAPIAFNQAVAKGMDVISNSWGNSTFAAQDFSKSTYTELAKALENAVKNGRGGLGTIIVKSAGNYRQDNQSTNGSNFNNSPYAITVAGVGGEGDYRETSSPGASILVSAPTKSVNEVGIVTTDIAGSNGYTSGDYTDSFSGTSASAPMISGIVALMLEANPNLGYRDVQEILAYTARRYILNEPAPQDFPWRENGANNFNGGGLHYNNDYGYGLVDGLAAVRLAETWQKQQIFTNEQIVPYSTNTSTSGIDANGNAFIASKISVNSLLELDRIEVNLNLKHADTGELTVVLKSPSGTLSTLINSKTTLTNSDGTVSIYPDGKGTAYPGEGYKLSSTNFWGESAEGTWEVIVTDTKSNSNNPIFNGWTLSLRGDALSNDNTYFYTNEFSNFTAELARKTLNDTSGIDTINAAAITSDINLNLTSGSNNTLAGNTLSIGNSTIIENAFGGDGNDSITGNGSENTLKGGRGNDHLQGLGGSDRLYGYRGNDILKGGSGKDWLYGEEGKDNLIGGGGDDYLSGGSDNDNLSGGSGQDIFVFDSLNSGIDIISDFNISEGDKIELSATGFGGGLVAGILNSSQFTINYSASTAEQRVIYELPTGKLYFDPDGTGTQTQIQVASLNSTLSLTNASFSVV